MRSFSTWFSVRCRGSLYFGYRALFSCALPSVWLCVGTLIYDSTTSWDTAQVALDEDYPGTGSTQTCSRSMLRCRADRDFTLGQAPNLLSELVDVQREVLHAGLVSSCSLRRCLWLALIRYGLFRSLSGTKVNLFVCWESGACWSSPLEGDGTTTPSSCWCSGAHKILDKFIRPWKASSTTPDTNNNG